ncbi:MAG: sigma 54-interacting transcriptional regulator [Candidatus Hydrogenedentales bacterium]|jgi:Nif-specific regulatory protein
MSAIRRPGHREEEIALGLSPNMETVHELVSRVAKGVSPVLILGERGTYKEHVARAIHQQGPRADRPFLKVSWPQIADSFVEAELFGVRIQREEKTGLVKGADGGTLYIESLSDFSLTIQRRFLHVLQDGSYQIPGTEEHARVDVRVIAASTNELPKLVELGQFLRPLYERLSVFTIPIPPLRERKAEILYLAQHFVKKHGIATHKPVQHISSKAMSTLMSYDWPGNLSELERCMEHAVFMCNEGVIDVRHLPVSLQGLPFPSEQQSKSSLQATLEHMERALIEDALQAANGNQTRAAQFLCLTERLMGLRVKKYNLDPKMYRVDRG